MKLRFCNYITIVNVFVAYFATFSAVKLMSYMKSLREKREDLSSFRGLQVMLLVVNTEYAALSVKSTTLEREGGVFISLAVP